MNNYFFIKWCIIGFSIAAPVGPIAILCIRRTLANGMISGFISGLGAATADAFYGAIAAYGLTSISSLLVAQQFWIRLVGGLFLLYLGVKTILARPVEKMVTRKSVTLFGDYFSTLFLTLSNPMTILAFVAVFAGLGVASCAIDFVSATVMVIGVLLGSAAWWLVLSFLVGIFRLKFNVTSLKIVNVLSGILIVSFAVIALASSILI